MYNLPQKLLAEFVGTFFVVLISAGAICAYEYLRGAGQTGAGSVGAALAYGFVVAAMVGALAHVSGAHLNPAVTIGCWVTKRLGTLDSIGYALAQLLGSLAAAYLLRAALPDVAWRPVSLGTPDLASDFTRLHGMALEAILAFGVVFVTFASNLDAGDSPSALRGILPGLAVTAGYLVGAPFTGAAMNPARAFGPALAITPHHWQNHGVYWVGPLFGGMLAAVVYDRIFSKDYPVT